MKRFLGLIKSKERQPSKQTSQTKKYEVYVSFDICVLNNLHDPPPEEKMGMMGARFLSGWFGWSKI